MRVKKLYARYHHDSWWVYDSEHDGDTGPYSTRAEAQAWIDSLTKEQS